jgi:hypothetical protein
MYQIAVIAIDAPHACAAQPEGTLDDDVEHRLHVRRRTGDHLQDFGSGRLPLQRLLGLVEQAGVLDRDNGLMGECLEQSDVMVSERASFFAGDSDRPDHAGVAD